jgi:hypothetical protein
VAAKPDPSRPQDRVRSNPAGEGIEPQRRNDGRIENAPIAENPSLGVTRSPVKVINPLERFASAAPERAESAGAALLSPRGGRVDAGPRMTPAPEARPRGIQICKRRERFTPRRPRAQSLRARLLLGRLSHLLRSGHAVCDLRHTANAARPTEQSIAGRRRKSFPQPTTHGLHRLSSEHLGQSRLTSPPSSATVSDNHRRAR